MAKKAKWLEESSIGELLDIAKEGFGSKDSKVANKAQKALDEIISRTPDGDDVLSVEDAIEAAHKAIDDISSAYKSELAEMDEDVEEEEDEEEDDEEEEGNDLEAMTKKELLPIARELGIKLAKKKSKEELIKLITEAQGEAEDEEEDDEESDYDSMSKKELLKEAKERGLKVSKTLGKDELIKVLEEDDDFEDDED